MIILITNAHLDGRTGTETFTRDLSFQLQDCGHTPVVYTQRIGAIGQEIAARGIPVTNDIMKISGDIDIIHGHHTFPTAIAVARFPHKPAIFVCHDFMSWHDVPPDLPSIKTFVALGRTSASRLTYLAGINPNKVVMIANGVDTKRFRPGPGLPERPTRALAFCRSHEFATVVREACSLRDVSVDLVGPIAGITDRPEHIIPQYDLVFASGRTAQEALICERAVICCDQRGLAGLMTRESFEAWGRNLGLSSLKMPLTVKNFVNEIDKYDRQSCFEFAVETNKKRSMERCVAKYLDLYKDLIAQPMLPEQNDVNNAYSRLLQTYSPHVNHTPWSRFLDNETHRDRNRFDNVPPDMYLTFGQNGLGWTYCDLVGFHTAELTHVWSSSAKCRLLCCLPERTKECLIELTVAAIMPTGCSINEASVYVNDALSNQIVFKRIEDCTHESVVSEVQRVTCRISLESTASLIDVVFSNYTTASPSPDPRWIGIMLLGLRLKYNFADDGAALLS